VIYLRFYKYLNDQFKEDEIGRHIAPMEAKKRSYWGLVGKPEGKRPLGRPGRV
jgi:hypothetical protein